MATMNTVDRVTATGSGSPAVLVTGYIASMMTFIRLSSATQHLWSSAPDSLKSVCIKGDHIRCFPQHIYVEILHNSSCRFLMKAMITFLICR